MAPNHNQHQHQHQQLSHFTIVKRDCKYTDGYFCYSIPQAAVAGIAIGSAALLLGLAFLTFICVRMRRRRAKRERERMNGEEQHHNQGDEGALRYFGAAKPEPVAFNPDAY